MNDRTHRLWLLHRETYAKVDEATDLDLRTRARQLEQQLLGEVEKNQQQQDQENIFANAVDRETDLYKKF